MSKKVNSVLVAVVFAALTTFAAVEGTEAFCIYNNTDRALQVIQKSGNVNTKGFNNNIDPGQNACCNWQNKDCNKKGKNDSTVTFDVIYERPGSQFLSHVCTKFPIRADGQMTVTGKDLNYNCE